MKNFSVVTKEGIFSLQFQNISIKGAMKKEILNCGILFELTSEYQSWSKKIEMV